MDKKQRFFIYDRKEVGVLLLLGVMVAVFAFTLGVHLGKRVTGKSAANPHATPSEGVSPVAETTSTAETEHAMTQPTAVPSAMVAASEDAVNQATHDEVSRTGIKLEESKQLELPEKSHSKNAGATTPTIAPTEAAAPQPKATEQTSAEIENPQQKEALAELKTLTEKSSGRYTLQIGSYSNQKEAQDRVKDLEISGLHPRIHGTDIKSKGRWYRIYLGGFPTKAAAEKAGEKYRAQGMIDSFIVAKSVE
jgi:cell division protein FtsN